MPSDAHKRARNKWDAANMANLAVKVRRDYAERVRAACQAAGTTPAAVIRAGLDRFLQEHDTSGDN